MLRPNARLSQMLAGAATLAVMTCLAVAISGAGTVAHASSLPTCASGSAIPCVIGNLEIVSLTGSFFGPLGIGCLGTFKTITILDSDPLNPGFSRTGNCVTTLAAGVSDSSDIQIAGLNGFRIGDLSGSVKCGVAGGDAVSVTFTSSLAGVSPLVLNCPAESKGVAGTLSGDETFAPVTGLTETATLAFTGVSGGSATLISLSNQFSLVPPVSTVPEPGALLLIGSGLCGIAGVARRRLMM